MHPLEKKSADASFPFGLAAPSRSLWKGDEYDVEKGEWEPDTSESEFPVLVSKGEAAKGELKVLDRRLSVPSSGVGPPFGDEEREENSKAVLSGAETGVSNSVPPLLLPDAAFAGKTEEGRVEERYKCRRRVSKASRRTRQKPKNPLSFFST